MTAAFAFDLLLYALCLVGPVVALRAGGLFAGDPLMQWCAGLTLGLFAVPMLAYAIAVALHTHLSPGLLLSCSLALAVAGAARGGWQRLRARSQP